MLTLSNEVTILHTLWKGSITFGLVSVPVKLHAATEDKDITFKTVHKQCGTPLNQIRSCATCQSQVESNEVIRGYEYEPGKIVLFEKDEIENVLSESSKEIKVLQFLNNDEISSVHYQKSYYLSPDTLGVNGYHLLLEAMKQTNRVALCKLSIRSKSSLAVIQIIGECLTLTTMYYPDELRNIEGVPNIRAEAHFDEKGLELARMLITHMSKPYLEVDYRNESREQIVSYIEAKIAGNKLVIAPQPAKTTVVDLMAALQASIDALQQPSKIKKSTKPKRTQSKQNNTELPGSVETA